APRQRGGKDRAKVPGGLRCGFCRGRCKNPPPPYIGRRRAIQPAVRTLKGSGRRVVLQPCARRPSGFSRGGSIQDLTTISTRAPPQRALSARPLETPE